ncbi:AraC-like DNA-binding protein [Kibdelosporangium banguiense]|uniref:AraC-like DNA-binding protein n=1 Tax=Kibdelosporangium banguiense TaxID=1365924 RepID=A0ABS4TEF1_9PSEU|nr:helix-turn-helix domain-containing protein [Kibdelosporangium banguiense]MBP2322729.1 AraC-like DNA-binding protein [Kibdelosporangium banguiense]
MSPAPEAAVDAALGAVLSSARLWVAPGHAVYVGPSLRLDTHVGSVACLVLGLDGTVTVDVPGHSITGVRSALVPPRLPHKITVSGRATAFCYLEPAAAAACRARMDDRHVIAVDHRDEDVLSGLAIRGGSLIELAVLPTDARILAATRTLHSADGIETPAAVLAAQAGLSLSRFLHLFVEQTGTGVRSYRRWARMLIVAQVVSRGGDLTRAAADAGFATPSHFSAAFRRMFGLTPSRLLATGVSIAVA